MTPRDIKTWKDKLGITDEQLGAACTPRVTKQCVSRVLVGSRNFTPTWEKRLRAALKEIIAGQAKHHEELTALLATEEE